MSTLVQIHVKGKLQTSLAKRKQQILTGGNCTVSQRLQVLSLNSKLAKSGFTRDPNRGFKLIVDRHQAAQPVSFQEISERTSSTPRGIPISGTPFKILKNFSFLAGIDIWHWLGFVVFEWLNAKSTQKIWTVQFKTVQESKREFSEIDQIYRKLGGNKKYAPEDQLHF